MAGVPIDGEVLFAGGGGLAARILLPIGLGLVGSLLGHVTEKTLRRKYHEGRCEVWATSCELRASSGHEPGLDCSQVVARSSQPQRTPATFGTCTNECKHCPTNHFGCKLMRCYNPNHRVLFACDGPWDARPVGFFGWLDESWPDESGPVQWPAREIFMRTA